MYSLPSNSQENCLPFFPSGLPDEHISSRVARFHIKSGNLRTATTFRSLFDKEPFSLAYFVQPYLDRLVARLPGDVVANMALMEKRSTLIPLYRQFYDAGSQREPVMAGGALMKRVVGDPGLTRVCAACLVDDEKEHGSAYLHRSHQIPGVTSCWRHGTLLLERCPACGCPYSLSKEVVTTPWCGCGLTTVALLERSQPATAEFEKELALFARDLLNAEPLSLTPLQLSDIYRQRAHELGMNRGETCVDRKKLCESILNFFGKDFFCRTDPGFRKGAGNAWWKAFQRGAALETPLYRHVVISYFLFREYSSFRLSAQKFLDRLAPKMESLRPTDQKGARCEIEELLSSLLNVALRYGYDIKQLWRLQYGRMRRLAKFDINAIGELDRKLRNPPKSRRHVGREKVARQYVDPAEDANWSLSITAAATALYESNDRPVRVTAFRILKTADYRPKGMVYPRKEWSRSYGKLNEYAEGAWHFYARRVVWALQSLVHPDTPNCVIIKLAGMEWHKGLAVLKFFSDCERACGATAVSVSAVLSRKNINYDWDGPCPGREFRNPGRGHKPRNSP